MKRGKDGLGYNFSKGPSDSAVNCGARRTPVRVLRLSSELWNQENPSKGSSDSPVNCWHWGIPLLVTQRMQAAQEELDLQQIILIG